MANFIPIKLFLFFGLVMVRVQYSDTEFPRLSTMPPLYSSPDTVLTACLGVNITFECEFTEEHQQEIIMDEGALIMANDIPISVSAFGQTERSLSVSFIATTLNVTHPVSNFSCGTRIRPSPSSKYGSMNTEVWASQSNVIKIKFLVCPKKLRRSHRVQAGNAIKLICPFWVPLWTSQIGPYIYDWDLDGFPLHRSDDKYRLNANGSSLTIQNATTEDSGVYRCFHKLRPLVMSANTMSHDLTVLPRVGLVPDKLILTDVGEDFLNITWSIEVVNRAGIKRFVNHSAPFGICVASLTTPPLDTVITIPVSTLNTSVRIRSLKAGSLYAMQPIGETERCFQRQDNVQFFATLSPGERWETGQTAQMVRRGANARAVYPIAGEKAILYCGANLENLQNDTFTVTWYNLDNTRIVSKPNGRRKIEPRTGALVFDKSYTIDQYAYRCNIHFHNGPSGLIKGDHVTDQWIYLHQQNCSSSGGDFNYDLHEWACTNITENSLTIKWKWHGMHDHVESESPTTEDPNPSETNEDDSHVHNFVHSRSRRDHYHRRPRPINTLRFLYWVPDGMGNMEAPDVQVANTTTNNRNGIVLERLEADTLYFFWITEINGNVEVYREMLQCWTDGIRDPPIV